MLVKSRAQASAQGQFCRRCNLIFRALEATRARDEDEFGAQGSHLGSGEASCGEDASGPGEVVGNGSGVEPCRVRVEFSLGYLESTKIARS